MGRANTLRLNTACKLLKAPFGALLSHIAATCTLASPSDRLGASLAVCPPARLPISRHQSRHQSRNEFREG